MKCLKCKKPFAVGPDQLCADCAPKPPMKTGIELIAAERERQITAEGYTAAHDDRHSPNDLLYAAWAYIEAAIHIGHGQNVMAAMCVDPEYYPWKDGSFKPSHVLNENLKKAGALIAAAMDHDIRHNDPGVASAPHDSDS